MGTAKSYGIYSLNNVDPSHHVEAKTGETRHSNGARFLASFDGELDGLGRRGGGWQEPLKKIELGAPIQCPCCRQGVTSPTLEIVADRFGLTPLEARVLGAIWRGKGMPVMTERVFDSMYVDDPDGGPTPSKMYLAFKVALCHLRKKIEGSGVDVVNVGYRRGYRLVIGQ